MTSITVRSPADLLAAVPYLLGFHPAASLVAVALDEKKIAFAARGDLPPVGAAPAEVANIVRYVAAVVAHQGATAAAVIGYGPPGRVDPVLTVLRDELAALGVRLIEALRATGGRYWSYLCDNEACCPPEGTPYDASTSEVAAAATYAGQVVLPDRDALVRQVAPVGGSARAAVERATIRAEERLAATFEAAAATDRGGGRAIWRAGEAAVADALARGAAGQRLGDDEVAWLGLLLQHTPVRDLAWQHGTGEEWQVELWADVTRRVEADLVPAPAGLLAFAAWRTGNGALANVAVDRALAEDPGHPMALLVREALQQGLSPHSLTRSHTVPPPPPCPPPPPPRTLDRRGAP